MPPLLYTHEGGVTVRSSVRLFVPQFVCYPSREHDILTTMQIGTSGQGHESVNFGVKRSKLMITGGRS